MLKQKRTLVTVALVAVGFVLCLGVGLWRRSKTESYGIEQIYQLQESIVKHARGDNRDYDNLREAALWAAAAGHYDQAKQHAQEVLALAPRYNTTPPNYRYGLGIHDAHCALGRAALAGGDVPAAKRHLFASIAQVKDNTMFRLSGPKMGLAKDLLDHGERDTFLQFLSECEKTWTSARGQKQLQQWKADVQSGKSPNFAYKARL